VALTTSAPHYRLFYRDIHRVFSEEAQNDRLLKLRIYDNRTRRTGFERSRSPICNLTFFCPFLILRYDALIQRSTPHPTNRANSTRVTIVERERFLPPKQQSKNVRQRGLVLAIQKVPIGPTKLFSITCFQQFCMAKLTFSDGFCFPVSEGKPSLMTFSASNHRLMGHKLNISIGRLLESFFFRTPVLPANTLEHRPRRVIQQERVEAFAKCYWPQIQLNVHKLNTRMLFVKVLQAVLIFSLRGSPSHPQRSRQGT
jgi:hypothetical protein